MSHGDLLSDRKRLKQKLSSWRILALVSLFGAVAVILHFSGVGGGKVSPGMGYYIAKIRVENIIADDAERDELLAEVRDDAQAKALIVWMNSPGGTTVGGEELFLQLEEIAKTKPVVVVMRTLCASACYMAALGADHIIARNSTLTGSIGVLLESVEVSRLADKLGVTPITITSGKYKDVPSMTKPITDEQRAYLQVTIDDAYGQFIEMVAKKRGLSDARTREVADGRIYTGRQALPLKLIDQIGGEEEARQWLVKEKKLSDKLKITLIENKERKLESLFTKLSQWTNVKIFGRPAVGLDGLVSIWQSSPVQ